MNRFRDVGAPSKGNPGERLVFSRILGHFEIPRSHKWVESSNCWVCEKHTYTVVFASETIAKNYFVKPYHKDKENFVKKVNHAKAKQEDVY